MPARGVAFWSSLSLAVVLAVPGQLLGQYSQRATIGATATVMPGVGIASIATLELETSRGGQVELVSTMVLSGNTACEVAVQLRLHERTTGATDAAVSVQDARGVHRPLAAGGQRVVVWAPATCRGMHRIEVRYRMSCRDVLRASPRALDLTYTIAPAGGDGTTASVSEPLHHLDLMKQCGAAEAVGGA